MAHIFLVILLISFFCINSKNGDFHSFCLWKWWQEFDKLFGKFFKILYFLFLYVKWITYLYIYIFVILWMDCILYIFQDILLLFYVEINDWMMHNLVCFRFTQYEILKSRFSEKPIFSVNQGIGVGRYILFDHFRKNRSGSKRNSTV